jgi:adenine phosphoribosyltransferase
LFVLRAMATAGRLSVRMGSVLVCFHDELVARLEYFEGHSDTLGLFADGRFLARAGAAMADPFRPAGVQKVAGIEARGFVLATAVALELGVGFVAVRKQGSIHPGAKAELAAPPDWRGLETVLRLQRHVIEPGELVLVVDDWAETGSKALTARRLIEACGGRYAGLSLLVDQLPDRLRDQLAPVSTVALAEEVRS